MPESTDPEDVLRAALQAMRTAYDRAASAIEAIQDPYQAFERATVAREVADELVGRAAELRARMVGRIRETEKMSLATLADRIGVSKARAGQFIQTAQAAAKVEKEDE